MVFSTKSKKLGSRDSAVIRTLNSFDLVIVSLLPLTVVLLTLVKQTFSLPLRTDVPT
jgi:hypothetical protein